MFLGATIARVSAVVLLCLVCVLSFTQAQHTAGSRLTTSAHILFERKDFTTAAKHFRLYIEHHPRAENVPQSMFMLGECLREDGRIDEAETTFKKVITTYKEGNTVGEAAYRLGVLQFQDEKFADAAKTFGLASREVETDSIRLQANYFRARSYQHSGQPKIAIQLFEQIIHSKGDQSGNHFVEKTYLEVAHLLVTEDQYARAADYYRWLDNNGKVVAVREEAIATNGFAAIKNDQVEQGIDILLATRKFTKGSQWRFASYIGSMYTAYQREDFERVIEIYTTSSLIGLKGKYRAMVLSMIAECYRKVGKTKDATRLYSVVESRQKNNTAGYEAGYQKLVALYHSGTGYLPSEVNKYTKKMEALNPSSDLIDKAHLLVAEWHFVLGEKFALGNYRDKAILHYREAGQAYSQIRKGKLAREHLPTAWYHQSWAHIEAGELIKGSIVIDRLLNVFPKHPNASAALAKRGESYMANGDYKSARSDLLHLTQHYPECPEMELALERMGRIEAHLENHNACIDNYSTLLRKFPSTKGSGEANFWIGMSYFEQQKFYPAIEYLERARQQEPRAFGNHAGIRLIYCYNETNQTDKLVQMCHLYIQSGRDIGGEKQYKFDIPKRVLVGVGKKLAAKQGWIESEYFLKLAANPKQPSATPAWVWNELGIVQLKLQKHTAAITSFDHAVSVAKDHNHRGQAYLERSRAELQLKKFSSAKSSARECLRVVRGGRINADARILVGDVLLAEDKPKQALVEYQLVSQLYKGPEITPIVSAKIDRLKQGHFGNNPQD